MPKKVDSTEYKMKQNYLLNKLLDILGITNEKKSFLLQDIDNNDEKQKMIYDLEPEIKKNFIIGKWNCFKTKDTKRKWLSIIRCLLKELDHDIISSKKSVKKEDSFISITEYHIILQI